MRRKDRVETKVLLAFSDVVAGYATPVVGPLSFELQAGQVIGLGGSNGSSKFTLLRAVILVSHERVFLQGH